MLKKLLLILRLIIDDSSPTKIIYHRMESVGILILTRKVLEKESLRG
jgi:hypothetical protein